MEMVTQSWQYISASVPYDGNDESLKTAKISDVLRLLEIAGRTCYKSEGKITPDSAEHFVKDILMAKGHFAMIEHAFIGARMITDRGVTHEIVRHRISSYAQESTRYCNYGKLGIRFIVPVDFTLDEEDMMFLSACEAQYNRCLTMGRIPGQARYFLPNGLKTEIVMSCNIREWQHFFSLRADVAAHAQMRALASSMLVDFAQKLPALFKAMAEKKGL
jgi:thymidylate synthase (FAD)